MDASSTGRNKRRQLPLKCILKWVKYFENISGGREEGNANRKFEKTFSINSNNSGKCEWKPLYDIPEVFRMISKTKQSIDKGMEKQDHCTCCYLGCQMMPPQWKRGWSSSETIQIELLHHLAILQLDSFQNNVNQDLDQISNFRVHASTALNSPDVQITQRLLTDKAVV